MTFKDLTLLPEDRAQSSYHAPSPYDGRLPPGTKLYAVGWLETSGFATGEVPRDCVDRLVVAYESNEVIRDGTMGWHDCTMCEPGRWERTVEFSVKGKTIKGKNIHPVHEWRGKQVCVEGHGHHLLKYEDAVYICPVLIVHYILEHQYRPPQEFLDAVRRGMFLSEDDLIYTREARLTRSALRLAEHNPQVDTGLGEVAEAHLDAGEFDEAEFLYMHQGAYRKRCLGPAHPSVGESEESVARVRKQRGQAYMAKLSSSQRKPNS